MLQNVKRLLLLLALAGGLASCAPGDAGPTVNWATPTPYPETIKSPNAIMADVVATIRRAHDVHFAGSATIQFGVGQQDTALIDGSATQSAWAAKIFTVQELYSNNTVYTQDPSSGAWSASSNQGSSQAAFTLSRFGDCFSNHGSLTSLGTDTVDSHIVVKIQEIRPNLGGKATYSIAVAGPIQLVRYEESDQGVTSGSPDCGIDAVDPGVLFGELDFDQWDTGTSFTPPPVV